MMRKLPSCLTYRIALGRRPILRVVALLLVGSLVSPSCVANAAHSDRPVYFGTDIVPILTKLGCNGGGCHGKATGQNGFRLSLFGFDPDPDYESLVREARGRRILPTAPDQSLLLLKATAQVPHGGGRHLDESSDDYQTLRRWIAQGAIPPDGRDPRLVRIELTPTDEIMTTSSTLQLRVVAHFSDRSSRDVTRQAVYQSNEPSIATADRDGVVTTNSQRGLASVMARFGEQIATIQIAIPFVDEPAEAASVQVRLDQLEAELMAESPEGVSTIDRLMLRQWRRLGVVPSARVDDATFLRRVSIDICGTLPTSEEVREYLADTHPEKRARLIDRLLDRPEYASYFALKWADILQNRGAGYSTSRQRPGTALFAAWIRDSLESNKPYSQFVTEILTASGPQNEQPPTIWYRTVRKPSEYVESVAQAFLGVRVQCAQCHDHPTERWTQEDYFGLAAIFSRIGRKGGFADAEVPTDEIIYVREQGEVRHPRTGEVIHPRPLEGAAFSASLHGDPRRDFARWMTSETNPYFARTMANRLWAHFLGRGIIHPIDDARSTNPPSDPELLDALAQDFIASGFNIKHLIRAITNSHSYGLESAPHAGNANDSQTFARFYPRRLPAEVLLDGISQVLEVPTDFPGIPPGTRAIHLPDENVVAHFLDVFGRPSRMSACECERVDAPSLAQALELVNSSEIQRKLTAPSGFAARLASSNMSQGDLVDDVFIRVLGRHPRTEELRAAVDFLSSEPDPAEGYRSLLWSLLATNEFLFNH